MSSFGSGAVAHERGERRETAPAEAFWQGNQLQAWLERSEESGRIDWPHLGKVVGATKVLITRP